MQPMSMFCSDEAHGLAAAHLRGDGQREAISLLAEG